MAAKDDYSAATLLDPVKGLKGKRRDQYQKRIDEDAKLLADRTSRNSLGLVRYRGNMVLPPGEFEDFRYYDPVAKEVTTRKRKVGTVSKREIGYEEVREQFTEGSGDYAYSSFRMVPKAYEIGTEDDLFEKFDYSVIDPSTNEPVATYAYVEVEGGTRASRNAKALTEDLGRQDQAIAARKQRLGSTVHTLLSSSGDSSTGAPKSSLLSQLGVEELLKATLLGKIPKK